MSAACAIEKVRVEAGKKRLRINDRFQDFDKLRSGMITSAQFYRCLTTMNCNISDAEIALLCQAYPGKLPNTVDYGRFTAEVQGQEAPIELLSSLRSPPRSLGDDVETAIARFNEVVVQRVLATGVDVFSYFKDFDKHNIGVVTEAQFDRCFPLGAEPRIREALKKKYGDGKGNVLYHGWCNTIASAVIETERARSPVRVRDTQSAAGDLRNASPTKYNNPSAAATAEQLVATIHSQVAVNKLRCDEVFHDYDKSHTSSVTAGQFFSALGRLKFVKFQLTHAHLDTLAKAYGTKDSCGVLRVNYPAFLADIAPPVSVTAAAENSSVGSEQASFARTLPLVPLPEEEERRAAAVVEKVRHTVETCRIALKPALQDFDRSIKGLYQTRTCTKTRFQRALAINKLTLPPAELELLCKKYAVAGADGQLSDDINYTAFCADVEPPQVAPPAIRGRTALLPTGNMSAEATTVQGVLNKLANQVAARKVRLSEFFKDFDPLRSGVVASDKFGSAIAIAGLRLTQSELSIVTEAYATQRLPKHVDIVKFLADVDTIDASIEPTAAGSYTSASLRTLLGSNSTNNTSLNGSDMETLGVVIQRVSEHVKHHGLLLPPFFVDYDRHHTGRITKTQFTQTLSRHKLPISGSEAALLCRAYGDSTQNDMVLYRSFIGDVDDAENVSLQLSIRSASRKPLSPTSPSARSISEAMVEAALRKVTAIVLRKSIRLDEFFQDGDSLRHRCVPSCRFRGALCIVGVQLSEEELKALEVAYHTDRIPNGVDYLAFSAEIHRRTAEATAKGNGVCTNAPAAMEEGSRVARVVAAVRKAFGARRLSVRPQIQDFDKLRKGTVTEAQFFSCLTAAGLRLEGSDIAALREGFGAGGGLITYHKFCDSVDSTK